jgi:hypothetical protein
MALSNYTELQAAITKWAMRSGDADFEATVPDFIVLCERLVNGQLRVRQMEATATLTLDVNGEATLPGDYLAFRDVTLTTTAPPRSLYAVSPDYATQEHPFEGGQAQAFSISGDTFRMHPKGAGDVRLRYYAAIPALSNANVTNWLLTKAPDVYLYGSLIQTAPFMMDDARMAVWGALFDKGMEALTSEDHQAKYMRGQVRVQGSTP